MIGEVYHSLQVQFILSVVKNLLQNIISIGYGISIIYFQVIFTGSAELGEAFREAVKEIEMITF